MTNEYNPDGKEIRFIDSHYKDLFHIPDGSCVQIHYPDEMVVKPCTFIDEYHTQIGYNVFHICQFAEIMERNGASYMPEPEIMGDEAAWKVGKDRILAVQTCEDGYDYTLLDENYNEIDGGQVDNPELSIMTSKSPVRSCDDVDEQALSYAEIKALCAGNPLIKEKMDLDIDVARLKVLKADHQSQQYRMEDKLLKYFPAEIEKQTGYIHGFEADIKTVEAHPQIADGFCGMEIMGKAYTEKADAGEILLAACKDTKSADPVPLGSYRGFQMELSFDSFRNEFDVTLKGAVSHRVALGTDARGNITRLDNALAGILERLERANEQLNNLYNQQEAAKAEVGKPFPQEAELTAKSQRLAELDAALNMEDSVENRDERSESERPSVLADLKSKAEHIPPAKYSETREEVL